MSKISDFSAKQNAFMDRLEAAVDGLTGDIAELKALVEQLQNTPGEINEEDQALLDSLQTRVETATAKAEALDALTEKAPEPPTE